MLHASNEEWQCHRQTWCINAQSGYGCQWANSWNIEFCNECLQQTTLVISLQLLPLQNWKARWFVLVKNDLKYYRTKGVWNTFHCICMIDTYSHPNVISHSIICTFVSTFQDTKPIRTIDLTKCIDIEEDESSGKTNCFKCVKPSFSISLVYFLPMS